MTKASNRGSKIVLYGLDISDVTQGWAINAPLSDAITVELDVLAANVLTMKIVPPNVKSKRYPTTRADVRVGDGDAWTPDVSKHVWGWDEIVRVGQEDIIRLYLYADSDVLSINGTTPWEETE